MIRSYTAATPCRPAAGRGRTGNESTPSECDARFPLSGERISLEKLQRRDFPLRACDGWEPLQNPLCLKSIYASGPGGSTPDTAHRRVYRAPYAGFNMIAALLRRLNCLPLSEGQFSLDPLELRLIQNHVAARIKDDKGKIAPTDGHRRYPLGLEGGIESVCLSKQGLPFIPVPLPDAKICLALIL